MLAAVQLDNYSFLRTTEINNVSADGKLAPEFEADKCPGTEIRPHPAFNIGLIPS